MYNLNVFSIGLFCSLNYLLYNVGSEAKSPVFGQIRQIVCLLDDGVSHFVDRLDTFSTYLSSDVDLIDNNRIK